MIQSQGLIPLDAKPLGAAARSRPPGNQPLQGLHVGTAAACVALNQALGRQGRRQEGTLVAASAGHPIHRGGLVQVRLGQGRGQEGQG